MSCRKLEIRNWRTPNEWWFVAACQTCGLVASSISDGGTAMRALMDLHEQQPVEPVVLYDSAKLGFTLRKGQLYVLYPPSYEGGFPVTLPEAPRNSADAERMALAQALRD